MNAMGDVTNKMLDEIGSIIKSGLDTHGVLHILKLLEGPHYSKQFMEETSLYSELLPMGREKPFTQEQRYLHFLWDTFDKLPICLNANFGIIFRRLIAERLFKKCGDGFISEENFRFNFGQYIEVGDFVFFNRGVFIVRWTHLSRQFFRKVKLHPGAVFMFFCMCSYPLSRGLSTANFRPLPFSGAGWAGLGCG